MSISPWLNLKAGRGRVGMVGALVLLLLAPPVLVGALGSVEDDEHTAAMLAEMLRAARAVVAEQQDHINNPDIGDKGLGGAVVLDEAVATFREKTGVDPAALEAESRDQRLLAAMQASIREVVDEHQDTINAKGMGFKGFIPAVVGRLVSERFVEKAGDEALIRVTAPPDLIRNRRARPDAWETATIEAELLSPDWPRGQVYSEITTVNEREAFRVLVPEYYTAGCLSCHGKPEGEIDITGYPKEGGELNQLGGVISISLFR